MVYRSRVVLMVSCYIFFSEMKRLEEGGIIHNGVKYFIKTSGFCCDAPARAFICQTKSYTAYYCCSKCEAKGKWKGCIVLLNIDRKARDDGSFRKKLQMEHHVGTSILDQLNIDMINSFPQNYMHLTCLGVMRKLLWAWKKGPLTVRIGTPNVERISQRLITIKSCIPKEFARKPRSLDELARWKATELRQFLLYTGPVVLKGILNEDVYNHFVTFHLAIRILTSVSFSEFF